MNTAMAVDSHVNGLKSKRISEATIQDIQLELIRRRRFRALDGERVADALLRHRDLWEAVMMDRIAVSNPGFLPALGLVKLRDLLYNEWNVDTLYILTPSKDNAERLAKIIKTEDWGGLVDVHADSEEVDIALGGAQAGQAVVSIWWD